MSSAAALLHFDCAELLHREAELLDDGRLDEWLTLLAPEMTYEVRAAADGGWFAQETRATLEMRVRRLGTSHAWAEEPRSRTLRLVGTIRAREVAEQVEVRSAVFVYRVRDVEGPGVALCGERRDRLQRGRDGALMIAARSVRLMDRVLPMPNLAIVL